MTQVPRTQERRFTEPLAVWGFCLAILFWPLGLVLSIIARRRIRESGADGDGFALAGIILGSFALITTLVVGSVLVARHDAQTSVSEPDVARPPGDYTTSIEVAIDEVVAASTVYRDEHGEWPTERTQLGDLKYQGSTQLTFSDLGGDWCVMGYTGASPTRYLESEGRMTERACPS